MEKSLHYPSEISNNLIQQGKELITKGRTRNNDGKLTKKQSKHFLCTNCHNIKREDPILNYPNPEDRLNYCAENDLPFLQGTTLFGVVNRISWYNGDYEIKYGEQAKLARDTLINAIQLCATECSQGREFEEWELDAVLAYLHSIGLKAGDVLNDMEIKELNNKGFYADETWRQNYINRINSRILLASPAKFVEPLKNVTETFGKNGDKETGAKIYLHSCIHCHNQQRVTFLKLSVSEKSLKKLSKKLGTGKRLDAFKVIREGTHPYFYYKPYMPQYTINRMSNKQLEDLAAYLKGF